MAAFRCVPMPTATAGRFRRTGVDDRGNALRRMTATRGTGSPCRHCLRFAAPGGTVLLGSYDLPGPKGISWTPSPVFLHAGPCPAFDATDVVAPIIADGVLVPVRAYDADDQCLYDLGQVCPGAEVGAPLARALADPRTSFVNIHTARPGCLLARVERVGRARPGRASGNTTKAPTVRTGSAAAADPER